MASLSSIRFATLGACAALALGLPASAALAQAQTQGETQSATTPSTVPQSAEPGAAAPQTARGQALAAQLEKRIREIHDNLEITPQQEPAFQALATAMRQGAVRMDAVYADRASKVGKMNAVDDLRNYANLTQAQAQNVQDLIQPFGALYASLSPDQKVSADKEFQHIGRKMKAAAAHH